MDRVRIHKSHISSKRAKSLGWMRSPKMHWYFYKTSDNKVRGLCQAQNISEIYVLAGTEECEIWNAVWNGVEFEQGKLVS